MPVLILLCLFFCMGEAQKEPEEEIAERMSVLSYGGIWEEKGILGEKITEVQEGMEENDIREEDAYEERVERSEDSVGKEYRTERLCVGRLDEKKPFNENIIGYTLKTTDGGPDLESWYDRDPDWVLPEELAGKGVYVSEHMCETEAFLGRKLAALLTDRG